LDVAPFFVAWSGFSWGRSLLTGLLLKLNSITQLVPLAQLQGPVFRRIEILSVPRASSHLKGSLSNPSHLDYHQLEPEVALEF
jgi:hypothetical protein